MIRQLEPELMEDPEQVRAYAQADFAAPHNDFIRRLKDFVGEDFQGVALDLGCGSGDICRRFVSAYPACQLHALDGSATMLAYANAQANPSGTGNIRYILGRLPDALLPQSPYDLIFSNSLLHHLPDPQILWQSIKRHARSGSLVVVMDLLRPDSAAIATQLTATHAGKEPYILQRDFYNSLLAAFRREEIIGQLAMAGLDFKVRQTSDRHVFITGIIG